MYCQCVWTPTTCHRYWGHFHEFVCKSSIVNSSCELWIALFQGSHIVFAHLSAESNTHFFTCCSLVSWTSLQRKNAVGTASQGQNCRFATVAFCKWQTNVYEYPSCSFELHAMLELSVHVKTKGMRLGYLSWILLDLPSPKGKLLQNFIKKIGLVPFWLFWLFWSDVDNFTPGHIPFWNCIGRMKV